MYFKEILFAIWNNIWGFLGGLAVKNPPPNAADARDVGSVPGLGRFPAEGNGNPLQYSCLEKSHGQRSLVGYNTVHGAAELDMTEHLSAVYIYIYITDKNSKLDIIIATLLKWTLNGILC